MARNRHPSAKAIQQQIEAGIEADRERQELLRFKRLPGNHGAPLRSEAEKRFRALAIERGCEVFRSGWPDFAMTVDGKLQLVEVKAKSDRLRASQVALFSAFEANGIEVYVWWETKPDYLIPWRRFQRMTDKARSGSSMGRTGTAAPKVVSLVRK